MLFRPILRLVGFFPTSCSPHDLVLTSDPTFTKYELLFVLSSYLKYCHTSLSRFLQLLIRDRLIFIRQFSNLAPTDHRNLRCRRSPDTEFQRHSKVSLNTEKLY